MANAQIAEMDLAMSLGIAGVDSVRDNGSGNKLKVIFRGPVYRI